MVYVFEKLKDGSAQKLGNVEENTQTVTFVYKPKEELEKLRHLLNPEETNQKLAQLKLLNLLEFKLEPNILQPLSQKLLKTV